MSWIVKNPKGHPAKWPIYPKHKQQVEVLLEDDSTKIAIWNNDQNRFEFPNSGSEMPFVIAWRTI